jgi:hypothetical protein
MLIIAHRGNTKGPDVKNENSPLYIRHALNLGFNVEIDIRFSEGNYYLGHDIAQYKISLDWLLSHASVFWIHCKTIETLFLLQKYNELNCFFHETDSVTLTTHNYLWSYPGQTLTSKSIDVMPELLNNDLSTYALDKFCFGICSDYPLMLIS